MFDSACCREVRKIVALAVRNSVECPQIGSNRAADEEICEVWPTGGELWSPKSEPCSSLKQLLEIYHGYHGNLGKDCYNLYYG
jgi:hypothetical protein